MEYYFYDLETSGRSALSARIMQFAGQRYSSELKPIGEPDNLLIKIWTLNKMFVENAKYLWVQPNLFTLDVYKVYFIV